MKEQQKSILLKNKFWKELEQAQITDNQFYNNRKEDFTEEFQNCIVISIARFLKHNNYIEIQNKTNKEILEYVFENYTCKNKDKIENQIGYITTTKNISTIASLRTITLQEEIFKEDIDYILNFNNALIIQKYKDRIAHSVFIKNLKEELQTNKELTNEFEAMLIILN